MMKWMHCNCNMGGVIVAWWHNKIPEKYLHSIRFRKTWTWSRAVSRQNNMVYFDEYKISLSKTRSNSNDGYTAITIVINGVTSSKIGNNLLLLLNNPTKKKAGVRFGLTSYQLASSKLPILLE